MNIRDFLNALHPIPDAEIRKAMPLFYPRNLKAKETMIQVGETPTEIGVVEKGILRSVYSNDKGQEYVKGFIGVGQFVGPYVSLLMGEKSNLYIQAIEDSSLLCIKFTNLLQLYESHPAWQSMGRKVAETLLVQREKRTVQRLMLSATERYERFLSDFPTLIDRVPQLQIASYLGITPVALSRIRKNIKDDAMSKS